MALQDILSTIEKKAQMEIQKIEKETEHTIMQIKDELKAEISRIAQENQAKSRAEMDEQIHHAEIRAKAEMKNAALVKKRQILDELFESLSRELEKLDENKKTTLYGNLAKMLPASVPDAVIITTPPDEKMVRNAFAHAGLHYKVEVRKTAENGFVLSSPTVEISNTLASLIKRTRDDIEADVAKILFEQ